MAGDFLPRNAPAQVLRSGLDFLIRLVGYALIELGQEYSAREQGRENQMATNRSAMTALVFLIASASHNWQSAQADEKATPPPQPGLSTHVLNTATGKPALGVTVILQKQKMDGWDEMSRAETDTQALTDWFSKQVPTSKARVQNPFFPALTLFSQQKAPTSTTMSLCCSARLAIPPTAEADCIA